MMLYSSRSKLTNAISLLRLQSDHSLKRLHSSKPSKFPVKDFLCISQLSNEELAYLIDQSIKIKHDFKTNPQRARASVPLQGSSMSMIFQKRSTRTRVSTETGMFLLGGHGLMLGPQDIQLGVNESLKDTGKILIEIPLMMIHKFNMPVDSL
jgi:ornithine carbamoyltransferase